MATSGITPEERAADQLSTVLIVEDDEDALGPVISFLQACGFGAVEARSASEALDVLRAIHVDAILTDFELGHPTETGAWLLDRAQSEGLLSGVVLIRICTGTPQVRPPASVTHARVMAKPLDYEAIRADLVHSIRGEQAFVRHPSSREGRRGPVVNPPTVGVERTAQSTGRLAFASARDRSAPAALSRLMMSMVTPRPSEAAVRYRGDDRGVALSAMSPADATATRELYSLLSSLERRLLQIPSTSVAASQAALTVARDFDLDRAVQLARTLGSEAGRSPEPVRQALHDLRGGALMGLLYEVEQTRSHPHDQSLRAMRLLVATHLKISRNAVLEVDDQRRAEDQRLVPHSVDRLERAIAPLGGTGAEPRVELYRAFDGIITSSCMELGALERAVLNLVNNALRYAADGRAHVALASATGAVGGDLRVIVANEIDDTTAQRLLVRFKEQLSRLFVESFTTTGSGEGLKICADLACAAYGLARREDAVAAGVIGASVEARWFLAWMHWPAVMQ